MGQKNEVKVRLATVIYLFIIVLVIALGIVYYLGIISNKDKNVEYKNEIIGNNDNNEKIDTENNVPKSDLVVATNDLHAYIEGGILYYTEEVSDGTFSKEKMTKDTQLSNIKRIKLYNIGVEANPVLFLITEDGEVYTMKYHFSKEIEKYEGLRNFKVEDILSHKREMYDFFEVLLKDGTQQYFKVYENIEMLEKSQRIWRSRPK